MDLFGLGKKPSKRTPSGGSYVDQTTGSQLNYPRSPTLAPRNLSPPPRGDSQNAMYNSSQYPGNHNTWSTYSDEYASGCWERQIASDSCFSLVTTPKRIVTYQGVSLHIAQSTDH
ncbi:hypothetical protein BC937DRAFT_95404 [Endogone sp. FLAS-F59071]|nr:hypothetical protein BC937DRAFT_95404 [Endogone sp. FLAS-F59071]|eukprot:RUS13389.1 hypothetical protein BC937DRAFT_95404 [Endogone sp. FLAS-F59071]